MDTGNVGGSEVTMSKMQVSSLKLETSRKNLHRQVAASALVATTIK